MSSDHFRGFLREQIDLRGATLKQFSAETGVSERHLASLLEGRFEKLPPAPYVRGYLVRIARALELPDDKLWELYRREAAIRTSGPEDRLPANRFALRSVRRPWLWGAAVVLLLIIFAITNADRFFGAPEFTITHPSQETTTVTEPLIILEGVVDPADKLTIGGEEAAVSAGGEFSKPYPLQVGPNLIEFRVKRILGREAVVERQVFYAPREAPPVEPEPAGESFE